MPIYYLFRVTIYPPDAGLTALRAELADLEDAMLTAEDQAAAQAAIDAKEAAIIAAIDAIVDDAPGPFLPAQSLGVNLGEDEDTVRATMPLSRKTSSTIGAFGDGYGAALDVFQVDGEAAVLVGRADLDGMPRIDLGPESNSVSLEGRRASVPLEDVGDDIPIPRANTSSWLADGSVMHSIPKFPDGLRPGRIVSHAGDRLAVTTVSVNVSGDGGASIYVTGTPVAE